jgi:hypothetical protein
MRVISRRMRSSALCSVLPLSLLLAPAVASADPDRLNNPAPPPVAPVAPPPSYAPPPPVAGYNPPPPVTGYNPPPPVVQTRPQPVMMNQQPTYLRQPIVAPPPAGRQGLFVGVLGGAAIPVVGDYAAALSTGFMGLGTIGWATPSGVSVRAELGVRSNSFSDPDFAGISLTSVFYGAGLRYTAPRNVFRPYVEALVDAFSVLDQTVDSGSGSTASTSSSTGVSVGAAVGAEIEVSPTFSLELAARYDHIVVSGEGSDGGTGGLVGVMGGGVFYFQ